MATHTSHHDNVAKQFGSQAEAYLTSQVHATGTDLQQLKTMLSEYPHASVLDMGCGAGHASFVAAAEVKQVVAYDLSQDMLDVVAQEAKTRELVNIITRQGYAERLPFTDGEFDIVITRYSAHHWHDVGQALREMARILRPGGKVIIMDIMSPGHPVFDIWLQTIEALRDTSHVRNYSIGEWASMIAASGLMVQSVQTSRLALAFPSWVARMRTPDVLVNAIRAYQQSASEEVKQHFFLQEDGSFTTDTIMIEAARP